MKQEIYDELDLKNDYYIHNCVNKSPLSNLDYQNVAKEIYQQRNLDSAEKKKLINDYPDILTEVNEMFNYGQRKTEVLQFLIGNNIEKRHAILIANNKFEFYKKDLYLKRKSKRPWSAAIFVLFIIIQLLIRSLN